jgi:hypothetical protein
MLMARLYTGNLEMISLKMHIMVEVLVQ